MIKRLVQTFVRVLVANILPDDVNPHVVLRILDPGDEGLPLVEPAVGFREVQAFQHDAV